MASSGATSFSRETRLLAATIGISIVVLVVLSRFRFPNVAADVRDAASAQPLARLAARAAFDDLSLAIRELSGRVTNSLLVVRATYPQGSSPDPRVGSSGSHLLPALRVRDDVAVVLTGEHGVVQAVVGMVTITLFVPCIASVMMIVKEQGLRTAALMLAMIMPTAFFVGGILNHFLRLFL